MNRLYYLSNFLSVLILFLSSCSTGAGNIDEPETPDLPGAVTSDTLELKINPQLDIDEEQYHNTRSGNSRDLIGVEITRKTSGSEWNAGVANSVIYASGVFDDIDNIVFKFVKGGTYLIKMCYYPQAKDIVYNYPNGTYGAPFSALFGLQDYRINDPVYYDGVTGGWSGEGNQGPVLGYLMEDVYQPTADRLGQSFLRGTTERYMGMTEYFTIDEDTQISVKLELCMMSITLQPDNFTEGELSLCFRNYLYMEGENGYWKVKPGDNMVKHFQTCYNPGEESLELFYTNAEGEKYLLATKQLQRKHRTNYVFKFSLVERADGSLGIQMPNDESFNNEDSTFDF